MSINNRMDLKIEKPDSPKKEPAQPDSKPPSNPMVPTTEPDTSNQVLKEMFQKDSVMQEPESKELPGEQNKQEKASNGQNEKPKQSSNKAVVSEISLPQLDQTVNLPIESRQRIQLFQNAYRTAFNKNVEIKIMNGECVGVIEGQCYSLDTLNSFLQQNYNVSKNAGIVTGNLEPKHTQWR